MKLNFNKEKLENELAGRIGNFIGKQNRWIMVAIALGLGAYCAYVWYFFVLNPSLSDGKKNEYIKTKETQVIFNRQNFDLALQDIERRKAEYDGPIQETPDMFRLE
ncbi:MAG TPA: hypothetical protein DIT25_02535 [Candidatus Moranbacteria bacterium]|nr:hypothetical protein [Candidatus Moranbacteria bacterium]